MTKIEIKKTLMTVGITTVVVFFADIIEDGIVDSPKGQFIFKFPRGWKLLEALAIGFGTALVLDAVIEGIKNQFKTEHEKQLEALVHKELEKIDNGEKKIGVPLQIIWKKPIV